MYDEQHGTCEIFRSPHHASRRSQVTALWYAGPGQGRLGHYTMVRFHPSEVNLGQLLTIHRGARGGGHRVNTLVTNAVE